MNNRISCLLYLIYLFNIISEVEHFLKMFFVYFFSWYLFIQFACFSIFLFICSYWFLRTLCLFKVINPLTHVLQKLVLASCLLCSHSSSSQNSWLLSMIAFYFAHVCFFLKGICFVCFPNYVCIPGQFHPQFFGIEMEIVLTSCDRCGFPAVTWRWDHAPPRNTNFQSAPRCPHALILCCLGGKARVWVHVSVLLKHRVLHRRETKSHMMGRDGTRDGQRPGLPWCDNTDNTGRRGTPWRKQMGHLHTSPGVKCPERLRLWGAFCSCPLFQVSLLVPCLHGVNWH